MDDDGPGRLSSASRNDTNAGVATARRPSLESVCCRPPLLQEEEERNGLLEGCWTRATGLATPPSWVPVEAIPARDPRRREDGMAKGERGKLGWPRVCWKYAAHVGDGRPLIGLCAAASAVPPLDSRD